MPEKCKPIRALIEAGRQMEARGLCVGSQGNLSVRLGDGFVVSASGVSCGALDEGLLCRVPLDGEPPDPAGGLRPSSEWRIHQALYRRFGAAQAIIHAHPPWATGVSCRGEAIPAFHYLVPGFGGDRVPCAAWALPGSEALSQAVLEAMAGSDGNYSACLMAQHGMVCYGATPARALARALELEQLAQQYVIACMAGGPRILDGDQVGELRGYLGAVSRSG